MKFLTLMLAATLSLSGTAFANPAQPQPDPGPRTPPPPSHIAPMPRRPLPGPRRPLPPPPPPAEQIPPGAQPPDVVRLGGTRLSPITDADTINVNTCDAAEVGRITDVEITAIQHTAQIDRIRVTYGNLSSDDIVVNQTIRPGETTSWIDLSAGGRGVCVRSIRVFGRSLSIGFKKTTVDIYGRRDFRSTLDLQDRREEN